MPSAERRQTARGTMYRAGWRDQDGIQRWGKAVHARRRDALAEGAAEERKVAAGRGSKDRQITWGEWSTTWLATRQVAASSNSADVVGKWIRPKWGPVKLRDITTYDVREWLKEMGAAGASPYTLQRNLSLLRTSLRAAAEVPYLEVNPCDGVRAPKAPRGPGVAFTQAEAQLIVTNLTGDYRTAAIMLLWMGLRFGEMAGMHWADVFEERRQVYVSHTWDRHGKVMNFQPKDEDCRWVPIPARVADVIGERPDNWREPCGQRHLPGDPCPGQLVLPGPRWAPLDSHNMLNRHWKKAVTAAGLSRGRQHDTRHTYITWLIEAGMTSAEVATLVGHSETWVTARYTHLLSKHHTKALDILDQLGPEAPARTGPAAARRLLRLIGPETAR